MHIPDSKSVFTVILCNPAYSYKWTAYATYLHRNERYYMTYGP